MIESTRDLGTIVFCARLLLIILIVEGCKFPPNFHSCFFLREDKKQQIGLNCPVYERSQLVSSYDDCCGEKRKLTEH